MKRRNGLFNKWRRVTTYIIGYGIVIIPLLWIPINKNIINSSVLSELFKYFILTVLWTKVLPSIANYIDPNAKISMKVNQKYTGNKRAYDSYQISFTNLSNEKVTLKELGVSIYAKKYHRKKLSYDLDTGKYPVEPSDEYKTELEFVDLLENAIGHFEGQIGKALTEDILLYPYAVDIHGRVYTSRKGYNIKPQKLYDDIENRYSIR